MGRDPVVAMTAAAVSWHVRLLDALLTTDSHQRIRLKQCGRATLLTLASCISMAYAWPSATRHWRPPARSS